VSKQNVDLARRTFTELAASTGVEDVARQLNDERLAEYYDPEIEWVPLPQSPLATGTYKGYDGVRRFWTEFLSIWEEFNIEPGEFTDADPQVAAVMRMRGRAAGLEIDELWSSLMTFRDGRIVRVQAFRTPDGAREAAGPGA
jgi:ketosteroid isomerase-like protein